MPRPSWYLQRGVCATAVTSLVGLVHPNIHRSCRRNVAGRGPLSVFTVASVGVNPCPSALYQSCSAWYCSSAKNSMAGTERKALRQLWDCTACVSGWLGAHSYCSAELREPSLLPFAQNYGRSRSLPPRGVVQWLPCRGWSFPTLDTAVFLLALISKAAPQRAVEERAAFGATIFERGDFLPLCCERIVRTEP